MATWIMVIFVQHTGEIGEVACGHRGEVWGSLATLTLPAVPIDSGHKLA